METLLVILALVIGVGLYFLYLKPKRRIQKFAETARQNGYRVKLMPFKFLGYYLVDLSFKDQLSMKDFKGQLTKYDLIVGNLITNLAIIPTHPDVLKDCFSQLSRLQKHKSFSDVFQLLKGGGIPFTEGQVWKRKRRIISTVFHYDFLNSMIPLIEAQTQKEFHLIDKKIEENQDISIFRPVAKILSSVISKCFFGTDANKYKIKDEYFCEYYMHTLNDMILYMFSIEHILLGIRAYHWGLTMKARQLKKRIEIMYQIVGQITNNQLEKIQKHEEKSVNMLTVLYEKGMFCKKNQVDPNKYTKDQLMGEFFAFFGAGTDTTVNLINLILHYLSEKPQYVEKLKNQIEQLQNDSETNTAEKLKNMKFFDAIINEALRINGPAASILFRTSTEKMNIGGLQIPKNTSVDIHPIINHYKTQFFQNPSEFQPERWLQNPNAKPYTFIPFGAGQRNCIGQYLARIQTKIIVSKFIKKYSFKAKNPIKMRYDFVYATIHSDFDLKPNQ